MGSAASLEDYWLLSAPYIIHVTLPYVASPSDYEIEIWDGTILSLTSTEQLFEVDVVPPVSGGTVSVWAEVVAVADPTVQAAEDNKPSEFGQFEKVIKSQVESWVGGWLDGQFTSKLKEETKAPFDIAKSGIADALAQLDPVDDAQKIQALTLFRGNQLPALHDQMVGAVKNIVVGQFTHTANATVRNGSEARHALDSISGISTTNADRIWQIDPVVKFQLSNETRDALLDGNFEPLKNDLEKPYKLFDEVGLGVKYVLALKVICLGN